MLIVGLLFMTVVDGLTVVEILTGTVDVIFGLLAGFCVLVMLDFGVVDIIVTGFW